MVDYSIRGTNLDSRGYVVAYGTFRAHVLGRYAGFRADYFSGMNADGTYWDLHSNLSFAIGLRNSGGTQVARAEYAPADRGAWKSFGNVSTGQYAINARMIGGEGVPAISYACGFHGLLRLG